MLTYEGLFFDNPLVVQKLKELDQPFLGRVNDIYHCTFKYKPKGDEIFDDLVGEEVEVEVEVIGYANNGSNSGFLLRLPDYMMPYYINYNGEILKPAHITASLAKGAAAKDTAFLRFIPFGNPFTITGRFGYWIRDEKGGRLSYEPYKKELGLKN